MQHTHSEHRRNEIKNQLSEEIEWYGTNEYRNAHFFCSSLMSEKERDRERSNIMHVCVHDGDIH